MHRQARYARAVAPTLSVVLLGVVVLAGCATNSAVSISEADRKGLTKASEIRVVRYAPGYMNMLTPKEAMGDGLIARSTGSAEIPLWHELERHYAYPNATEALADSFVQILETEGGLANLRLDSALLPPPVAEDPAAYRNRYPDGWMLELSVPQRTAAYGVMVWRTYYYSLLAQARLIHLPDAKIVWSDTCLINDRDDANLTFDVSEFEANDGERIKQIIRYSSERCSRDLVDSFLGKRSP